MQHNVSWRIRIASSQRVLTRGFVSVVMQCRWLCVLGIHCACGRMCPGPSRTSRRPCELAQVAVKVQRPRVLASVGLDLYVMREVAAALQRLPSVRRFGAAQGHIMPGELCMAAEQIWTSALHVRGGQPAVSCGALTRLVVLNALGRLHSLCR